MQLQKQQMELEKIKAEMEKAKADLGIVPEDAAGTETQTTISITEKQVMTAPPPPPITGPKNVSNNSVQITHCSITGASSDCLTVSSPITPHTTPMPGLVTCVGYQQHTAGHSDVPHTADYTAHHSVEGRDWDMGSVGSDVTAPTGLSSYVSNLSSGANSVSTTSEEGGLMLV